MPKAKTILSKATKSRQQLKETVIKSDPLKDYKHTRTAYWGELIIQGLPPWFLWIGRSMLDSDPLVKFALNIRNAMLMPAEIEVECDDPTIATWIQQQWDFIWNHHRNKFTSAKAYGYAALMVKWKEDEHTGFLTIKDVKDYAVEDSRCLLRDNDPVGMRVKGIDVYSPQALWMTYGIQYGNQYGNGILRRMYPAWFEKWMNHGAKRLLQLRMIKDAYIGDIFWYPPNQLVEIPNGDGTATPMPWKDVFREMAENRLAGNAMTLPRLFDDNGNPVTDYTPPQDTGGGSQIFEWNDLCDLKILQAADISKEIIEAAETGSGYSGRSIPFLTTLSVCNDELIEIISCFRRTINTAIWLNWGREPDYNIKAKSLVESFSDDIQGSPLGGGGIGGQPSQQPPTQLVQAAPPNGQQMSEEQVGKTRRLYRVEPKDLKDKGEWLKHHLSKEHFEKFKNERGRLFSDNLASLENYGHGSDDHITYHVDVPHHVAEAAKRKHHADDFHEYLLPQEYADKKKPLSSQHSEQFDEHSYSSTQFNITGTLADEIRALGMQIPDVDLVPTDYGNVSGSGREAEPHVTLLYGIHQ